MFKITLTARARKELITLSRTHQLSIGRIFEELKEDPYLGKPLKRELTGRFSYRIGLYRIIYRINKQDKTIQVITAGHRSYVYER